MSRKIVGLDIGAHSVKAILLRETLRGIDLVGFYEKTVGETTAEELPALIRALFKENGLRPDTVVASLPGSRISVHHLNLPFNDHNKIEQVLPYEIEPLIPFPVENVVVDHFTLGRTNGSASNGSAEVCTGVVPKEVLQQFLNILRGAALDPRIIELDSLALYHCFSHGISQEAGPVALVDIGATKTNLCIVSGGKPRVMRTLGHGGNMITRAIGEALGVSFSEAEQKKLSFTGTDAGDTREEEGKIAEAAQHVLKSLAQGIYQTLHSYETASGEPITTLYLSGGGARLAGLDDFFARALGRNIRRWKVPPAMEPGFSDCPEAVDLAMPGLGLALRGIRKDRDAGFNFRKGEFFARKEIQEIRGRLLSFTVILLAVILLGGLDFYSRLQDRESEYRQIKQEIRKVYLETFPGSHTIVDENQQIKTAVSELKKKVAALGGNVSDEVSPLDLLKEITDKLPPDIDVEVQDFMIDRGHVRIQGVTSSFDAADRVKKELEGIPYFRKVEITDAKLSADQKKVNFRISADIQ